MSVSVNVVMKSPDAVIEKYKEVGRLVDGGTVTVELLKEKLVLKTEPLSNKDKKIKKVMTKNNNRKSGTPEFT